MGDTVLVLCYVCLWVMDRPAPFIKNPNRKFV